MLPIETTWGQSNARRVTLRLVGRCRGSWRFAAPPNAGAGTPPMIARFACGSGAPAPATGGGEAKGVLR